jgi:hypothetical protein
MKKPRLESKSGFQVESGCMPVSLGARTLVARIHLDGFDGAACKSPTGLKWPVSSKSLVVSNSSMFRNPSRECYALQHRLSPLKWPRPERREPSEKAKVFLQIFCTLRLLGTEDSQNQLLKGWLRGVDLNSRSALIPLKLLIPQYAKLAKMAEKAILSYNFPTLSMKRHQPDSRQLPLKPCHDRLHPQTV